MVLFEMSSRKPAAGGSGAAGQQVPAGDGHGVSVDIDSSGSMPGGDKYRRPSSKASLYEAIHESIYDRQLFLLSAIRAFIISGPV
jgi:hypothetical protein